APIARWGFFIAPCYTQLSMKYATVFLIVLSLVSCNGPTSQTEDSSKELSRSFLEGYVSVTDAYAANALHGIAFHLDVPWKEIQPPFLSLPHDAADSEVGEFCGQFNAYVMSKQGDWALVYRDSLSFFEYEEQHPAVVAARGLAICSLLKGMKVSEAVDQFELPTPTNDGPFAENCELALGHDLWLLIKVSTSNWPRSEDGVGTIPPVEEMLVKEAFLYFNNESVTGLLEWAKLNSGVE
ncbi:MAG: hypothetical protein AB8C95_08865, partial [Phycisphaeraceae bacterium]